MSDHPTLRPFGPETCQRAQVEPLKADGLPTGGEIVCILPTHYFFLFPFLPLWIKIDHPKTGNNGQGYARCADLFMEFVVHVES